MPRATVSMVPEHHDLRTCPGGFVKLRRMSFGELLASQGMAYQVSMKSQEGGNDPEVGMKISQATVMEYQFKLCVMEHNLEDETGRMLDFKSVPRDVHVLDPRIGGEISTIIEKMHNWQQSFPNSETPSGDASSSNGASGMAKAKDLSATLPTSSSD